MKRISTIILAMLIALLCALPVSAETAELVYNGGFESYGEGDRFPDGWSFHSYEAEYSENYSNSSAYCEQDAERGSVLRIDVAEDDDAAVYQTVDVEPSSLYKLTCMIRTEGVENGQGANIALREIVAASEGVFGDSGWQQVELVGRTGPVQDFIVVSCRLGGYGMVAHGSAWFDDFTVEKIDSYDGDIVPFFNGETAEDEPSGGDWIVPVIIGAAAVAIIVAAVLLTRGGKKGGDTAGTKSAKPLPSVDSYKDDKARKLDEIRGRSFFDVSGDMPAPTDGKLRFTKKDRIYLLIVTVVYAAVGLIRLGTLNFPTNAWEANTGESVRIEFGRSVKISEIWQNSGISFINYKLVTDNGEEIAMDQKSRTEYGHMFRWAKLAANDVNKASATTGLTLTVVGGDTGRRNDPDLVMNELAIFDENGKLVTCTAAGAEGLFDEQGSVPDYPSYYNGMYFDELYHGRTALEHINNLTVYEWTHPPLGKLIIAVGILLFGMKPFGWRIMGVLFGVAMIPILYCFGKRLLKKSELALFSTVLFTFDFMHFTMMRIATVDTFAVFFILLMTYYMYRFISMDIADDPKRMLKPLALSGLFFGLGCATKWICMYTGAALAVLFFVKLALMGVKSRRLSRTEQYKDAKLNKKFARTAMLLCCWCVVFFIIVPVVIYCASYCRYYTAQWLPARQAQIYSADPGAYDSASDVKLGLGDALTTYVKGVIKNQGDMFNYHSQLKSDHSAASSWWMWLGDMRPTWFYVGGYDNPNGYVGTISAFGNPAVWICCTIASITLIFVLLFKRRRLPLEDYFLYVCAASSFLPWVLVPRSTYAYHFFATVPFITLLSGRLLGWFAESDAAKRREKGLPERRRVRRIGVAWMIVVLVLFIVFFPVISGIEVPREYISALQWFPFYRWQVQDSSGEVIKTYRIGWRFLDYEPSNPPTTIIVK
ncbi:MAG: glycosyltransferase family 39 protein [Clostridia bacterium]|nr:glycosyltransferase family 39 protein [Clostridia bacterium]